MRELNNWTRSNLLTRHRQGNLGEAEDLLREALEINKEVYGEEHPDFAIPLEFLAQNLFNQVSAFQQKYSLRYKVKCRARYLRRRRRPSKL